MGVVARALEGLAGVGFCKRMSQQHVVKILEAHQRPADAILQQLA